MNSCEKRILLKLKNYNRRFEQGLDGVLEIRTFFWKFYKILQKIHAFCNFNRLRWNGYSIPHWDVSEYPTVPKQNYSWFLTNSTDGISVNLHSIDRRLGTGYLPTFSYFRSEGFLCWESPVEILVSKTPVFLFSQPSKQFLSPI